MAIVQSSLAEEILSRQERAVIRGIYRASQLAEALVALKKVRELSASSRMAKPVQSVDPIEEYLTQAVVDALENTKVPANARRQEKSLKPVDNV